MNQQFLDGETLDQKKSFTKNQVFLGGVPIYVDPELRDKVIPRGTQKVEQLFCGLKEIDQYESIKNSRDNPLVRKARTARQLEQSQQLSKPSSWFEQ